MTRVNSMRILLLALAAQATLLVSACGLKDDLYLQTEGTEISPAEDQSTDDEEKPEQTP